MKAWLKGGLILSGIYILLMLIYLAIIFLSNLIFPLIAGTSINDILNIILAIIYTFIIYLPPLIIIMIISFIMIHIIDVRGT
ncbi:hypothetical protein CMI43_00720, partial [Candidatus Pacearchaeota archaeon]|nr:hypothetical protein [Candidatus Pacearchaeota archaeon]